MDAKSLLCLGIIALLGGGIAMRMAYPWLLTFGQPAPKPSPPPAETTNKLRGEEPPSIGEEDFTIRPDRRFDH